MAGRLAQIIDQWQVRKAQGQWAQAADDAAGMEAHALRALRAKARTMRREIDRVIHVADHRLGLPALGSGLPRMPLGTDWAWRADVWRGPLPRAGAVVTSQRSEVSDDLALFHDCPLGETAFRQKRNAGEADRAPFGLALDIFGFRGSFLSLALQLPDAAVRGLKARHLIRVDMVVDADRPLRGFARLNVKHGPNLAQMVSDLPPEGRGKLAEFDLAYSGIDESRIENAWLDLIFTDVAMMRIDLRDVVVSRRPRAEL